MDRHSIWKKMKKPVAGLTVVCLILLLFVLFIGQNHAAPDNPMDDKDADPSQMYLTASSLVMDESLLDGVDNANISSGGEDATNQQGQDQQEEDQQEEKDKDTQESEENSEDNSTQSDTGQEEQQEESTEGDAVDPSVPGSGDGISDSLMSLIQKHNGGSGDGASDKPNEGGGDEGGDVVDPDGNKKPSGDGTESTLSPDKTSELFTTSIVDGETVTDPTYPFSIILTEKGKKLNLVSRSVMVNGYAQNFPENEGTVSLAEGANKIQVTILFRDNSGNQIKAPTKTYTIYYVRENDYYLEVLHADSEEAYANGSQETVMAASLQIRIVARKGATILNNQLSVRLNNSRQNVQDLGNGVWQLGFSDGNNALKVVLGSNSTNQKTFTYTFNFQRETFTVTMTSPAVNESIQEEQFGGTSYATFAGDSPENYAFQLAITQATGNESIAHVNVTTRAGTTDMVNQVTNGYRTITLDATQATVIQASGTDSDGNAWTYTWQITYQRTGETPENKKPVITLLNLTDDETLTYTPYVLTLGAADYQRNPLYPENMTVNINGEEVAYSGVSGTTYEYGLNLMEGENHLSITITDNEQYTMTRDLTFYYNSAGDQASVTIVVDASNVRLGILFSETIQVPTGRLVSQIIEDELAAHGYATNFSGSITDGSYYLRSIGRSGLLNGALVSDERNAALQESGFSVSVPASSDWLGEFDYSSGSGWMITHNNDYFIGQSMGSRSVRDGDTIHLQFTLDMGQDCGHSS